MSRQCMTNSKDLHFRDAGEIRHARLYTLQDPDAVYLKKDCLLPRSSLSEEDTQ